MLLCSLRSEGCGQYVDTSRKSTLGVHIVEVEEETCSASAKEARTHSPSNLRLESKLNDAAHWTGIRADWTDVSGAP